MDEGLCWYEFVASNLEALSPSFTMFGWFVVLICRRVLTLNDQRHVIRLPMKVQMHAYLVLANYS